MKYRIRVVPQSRDYVVYETDDDEQVVREMTYHIRAAVELAHEEPFDGQWDLDCCYLYANPDLARQEARIMAGLYQRLGIEVEHNLDELHLEVSHGRG